MSLHIIKIYCLLPLIIKIRLLHPKLIGKCPNFVIFLSFSFIAACSASITVGDRGIETTYFKERKKKKCLKTHMHVYFDHLCASNCCFSNCYYFLRLSPVHYEVTLSFFL